jgi:general secretion pathway protein I
MRRPKRRIVRRASGFTLLEVMVALAILAAGLVVIVQSAASNLASTQKMRMLSTAVDLARTKMYEIEERLLDPMEGFSQMAEEVEGDFKDVGFEGFRWKASVEKIRIPGMPALEQMAGASGADAGPAGTTESTGSSILSMFLGGGGEAEGAGAALGAGGMMGGMIGMMIDQVKRVLEEAIRKVKLTILWEDIGGPEELVVVCFFTDPAAIQRVTAMPPAAGGQQP